MQSEQSKTNFNACVLNINEMLEKVKANQELIDVKCDETVKAGIPIPRKVHTLMKENSVLLHHAEDIFGQIKKDT